ncbi:MAG: SO_0444 family Cu/Zn efflux transporter [Methanosarcinales archaeon]
MFALITQIMLIISGILGEIWWILYEAAPYLLFGFFVAGILYIFIPKEKITKYLGDGNYRSILNASLIGIPLPLCSCGVVPTAISLRKSGASKGATMSFLISTPETGIDSIMITYALLDPIMTIFRPIAAFATATISGILENTFSISTPNIKNNPSCNCICGTEHDAEKSHSFKEKIFIGLKYAYVDLLGDISKWLIIGIIIAGIISYAVPDSFIQNYIGYGFKSMIIMLLIGVPMYICASASTPIAAVLIAKGISPGAAFVFLLTGPATNAATLSVLQKFFEKRSILIYLASISVCAILFGLLLNQIYLWLGLSDPSAIVGHASEVLPQIVKISAIILLIPLMIYGIYKELKE